MSSYLIKLWNRYFEFFLSLFTKDASMHDQNINRSKSDLSKPDSSEPTSYHETFKRLLRYLTNLYTVDVSSTVGTTSMIIKPSSSPIVKLFEVSSCTKSFRSNLQERIPTKYKENHTETIVDSIQDIKSDDLVKFYDVQYFSNCISIFKENSHFVHFVVNLLRTLFTKKFETWITTGDFLKKKRFLESEDKKFMDMIIKYVFSIKGKNLENDIQLVLVYEKLAQLREVLYSLSILEHLTDIFDGFYLAIEKKVDLSFIEANNESNLAVQKGDIYVTLVRAQGNLSLGYNKLVSWAGHNDFHPSKETFSEGIYIYYYKNDFWVSVIHRQDDVICNDNVFNLSKKIEQGSYFEEYDFISLLTELNTLKHANSKTPISHALQKYAIVSAGFVYSDVNIRPGCYLYLKKDRDLYAFIYYNDETEKIVKLKENNTYENFDSLINLFCYWDDDHIKDKVVSVTGSQRDAILLSCEFEKKHFNTGFRFDFLEIQDNLKPMKIEECDEAYKNGFPKIEDMTDDLFLSYFIEKICFRQKDLLKKYHFKEYDSSHLVDMLARYVYGLRSICESRDIYMKTLKGNCYEKWSRYDCGDGDYLRYLERYVYTKQREECHNMRETITKTLAEVAKKDFLSWERINVWFKNSIENSVYNKFKIALIKYDVEKDEREILKCYMESYELLSNEYNLWGRCIKQHTVVLELLNYINEGKVTVNGLLYDVDMKKIRCRPHDVVFSFAESEKMKSGVVYLKWIRDVGLSCSFISAKTGFRKDCFFNCSRFRDEFCVEFNRGGLSPIASVRKLEQFQIEHSFQLLEMIEEHNLDEIGQKWLCANELANSISSLEEGLKRVEERQMKMQQETTTDFKRMNARVEKLEEKMEEGFNQVRRDIRSGQETLRNGRPAFRIEDMSPVFEFIATPTGQQLMTAMVGTPAGQQMILNNAALMAQVYQTAPPVVPLSGNSANVYSQRPIQEEEDLEDSLSHKISAVAGSSL